MRIDVLPEQIRTLIKFHNETRTTGKYSMHSEIKVLKNNNWTDWKYDGKGVPLPTGDDVVYIQKDGDNIYLMHEDSAGKLIWRYKVNDEVRKLFNIHI